MMKVDLTLWRLLLIQEKYKVGKFKFFIDMTVIS